MMKGVSRQISRNGALVRWYPIWPGPRRLQPAALHLGIPVPFCYCPTSALSAVWFFGFVFCIRFDRSSSHGVCALSSAIVDPLRNDRFMWGGTYIRGLLPQRHLTQTDVCYDHSVFRNLLPCSLHGILEEIDCRGSEAESNYCLVSATCSFHFHLICPGPFLVAPARPPLFPPSPPRTVRSEQ